MEEDFTKVFPVYRVQPQFMHCNMCGTNRAANHSAAIEPASFETSDPKRDENSGT
jgi:hypothetical protein